LDVAAGLYPVVKDYSMSVDGGVVDRWETYG